MAIDPHQRTPSSGHSDHGDGLAKWLLGALGLLWVGGMAVRALRGERPAAVEGGPPCPAPGEVNRLGRFVGRHLRRRPHPTRGHESRDANVKWIFGIVLVLLVSVVAIEGLVVWYLNALKSSPLPTDLWRPVEAAVRAPTARSSAPLLQVSPPLDLQAFQAREQAALHSYGWISRTSGIVRLPIEQAMEAVLREGLPTRKATNENLAGPSSEQLVRRRLEHREPEAQGQK